ncbi:DUF4350 domain-containing protein [Sandaracinus amylolyticus]|uniref:DUF4350 domain-containing protein n=1 Tax=Sandaracinus amylolyticus TaxID=927083 RepID=UPI001F3BA726|nr:DUF4350 domain-containing protein [Sandaracinus amylolyticus]UJR79036.1 Hypothetical protein I5071_10690 [Sandaracinus amylolyticus]
MSSRPRSSLVALLALALVAIAARAGAQDADFAPESDAWNGLGRFVAIARERGVTLEIPARLDVGTLQPADALVIVSPNDELPAASLTDFMRAGGRIALGDDFGRGDTLLRTFRIGRGRPNRADALRLRGNEELLVARPSAGHPLTEGVSALVTNHPMVVYHPELEPIFSFGERDAVVLAGAVGAGRLVAIGDPSVLIANMLELRGNRRFAENLVGYLEGERGGRVFLITPGAVMVGRYGEPGADRPLHDVRAMLERLADVELPESALRIAAAAIAGILMVLAAGVLPRSSPYAGAAMFARPSVPGGFAGRIEWFSQRPANLGDPAMVYKLELEIELHRRLGLIAPVSIDDVANRMKARGMRADDVESARRLLGELAELREEWERGTRGDALPEARFRKILASGEALLEKVRNLG